MLPLVCSLFLVNSVLPLLKCNCDFGSSLGREDVLLLSSYFSQLSLYLLSQTVLSWLVPSSHISLHLSEDSGLSYLRLASVSSVQAICGSGSPGQFSSLIPHCLFIFPYWHLSISWESLCPDSALAPCQVNIVSTLGCW